MSKGYGSPRAAVRPGAPGSLPKLNPDKQGCLEWVVNRRECHVRVSTKKESFTKNPPGKVKLVLECRIIRGWCACQMGTLGSGAVWPLRSSHSACAATSITGLPTLLIQGRSVAPLRSKRLNLYSTISAALRGSLLFRAL